MGPVTQGHYGGYVNTSAYTRVVHPCYRLEDLTWHLRFLERLQRTLLRLSQSPCLLLRLLTVWERFMVDSERVTLLGIGSECLRTLKKRFMVQ